MDRVSAEEHLAHFVNEIMMGAGIEPDKRARVTAAVRSVTTPGGLAVLAERWRQVFVEGYTAGGDAGYTHGELADAAASYALAATEPLHRNRKIVPSIWPWGEVAWNPSDDPVRNLERAGALIAAELDRLAAARTETETCPTPPTGSGTQ